MRTKIALALGLVALVAFVSAQAAERVHADIPFPFIVGKQTFPAGQYQIVKGDKEDLIQIQSMKKGPAADILVITRLGSEIHTTPNDSHIVFDKVGDAYYLSELWLPGEDGYLLHVTKEQHTHRTVNSPR